MRQKITLAAFVFTLSFILIFAGCKKNTSTPAPTVVGNWQFSNFLATSIYHYANSLDTSTRTTTYNPQAKNLLVITTHSSTTMQNDTNLVSMNYSNWSILSNGTYVIKENESNKTSTTTGSWEYLSSSVPNDGISFENEGSLLFGYIQQFNTVSTLNIQSVTDHQMVLVSASSIADSLGAYTNYTAAITFTR